MEESCKEVLGFSVGQIPFKYFGVPLISSRLEVKDCRPLLNKFDEKLSNWNAASLSYAGRVQLIKSVLSAMQVFWSNVFILPKTVTEQIDAKIRRFLWFKKGGRGMHRVSWDKICRDKKKGGLGIVSAEVQNKVLQVKLLWEVILADKRKSIWVKWLMENRLAREDIWSIKPSASHPWSWKKLLKLREVILPHIVYKRNRDASWTLNNSGRFCSSEVRELFVSQVDSPCWYNLLKHQKASPRHCFILWVALHNGLTPFKLMDRHGVLVCCLCHLAGSENSMEHLLFDCAYSRGCLGILKREFDWNWPAGSWRDASVQAAREWQGSSRPSKYSKIILAVAIYTLWEERNKRLAGVDNGSSFVVLAKRMCCFIKEKLRVLGEPEEWRIVW